MIRIVLIVLLVAGAWEGWSQPGAEHSAVRALEKQKWGKSRMILEKTLRKDSTRSGILYGLSRYFFSPANPDYHIDSAHLYISRSLAMYALTRLPARKKLLRIPLDSMTLLRFRARIDSAAFLRARQANSEPAYNYFIEHFPHATQADTARQLRNEAAWSTAVQAKSPAALSLFLEKYPDSKRADEARELYEELQFRISTNDQRLHSFESFLADFPASPYRPLVEMQILEIATADGSLEKFRRFIRNYPEGKAAKRARDILYYLVQETENAGQSFEFNTDSIRHVQGLNESYLVPFQTDGKFGFMDASGREIIGAVSPTLYEDYRCGNIREDVIVHGENLIARDGTIIFQGPITELNDLGHGFIGIDAGGCFRVMHKTGFSVGEDCLQDAMVMDGRFVAIRINGQWEIYALTGRLLSSGWDEIKTVNRFIALRRNDEWFLASAARIGLIADRQPLDFDRGFDEVRGWPNDLIWVRREKSEAVLNPDLQPAIPFDEHELQPEIVGVRSRSAEGISLYGPSFKQSGYFEHVRINSYWACVKTEEGWWIFDPFSGTTVSSGFDSISFVGIFAAGHRGDSVRVFFDKSTYRDFKSVSLDYIPGKDSVAFLQVDDKGRKSVYDHTAVRLFDGYYDRIQYAGSSYFIVGRKEKKGLVDAAGKQVLPFSYSAIGELEGNRIPLLRNMKFGVYDVVRKKEIAPAFDKNIVPYNTGLLIGFSQGKCGIVDLNNRVRIPFQYDAFRYWNDTSALVRQGAIWQILDLNANRVLVDDIKDYRIIRESDHEVVAIIRRGNEYGVLSNVNGVVIPASYTDIVNIGSSAKPLYFTEKHVKEASLFVIIYYDDRGKSIRHQAFESDDYDLIYCAKNN